MSDRSSWSIQDKTVLVTGATNGIGKLTAEQLAAQGAHVVIVSRSAERCAAVVDEIRARQPSASLDWIAADLSLLAGVVGAAATFRARYPQLHVLVNNAGAFFARRVVTAEGYESTFALNHLSYFLLTEQLRELLIGSAPARVINVSSEAHQGGAIALADLMGERRYRGWSAYSQSKLANVLFTYSLARQLEGSAVTVNALHPGFVATGFGRNNEGWVGRLMPLVQRFALRPEQGAETSVYLATHPAVAGVTGKYFVRCQEKRSARRSYDLQVQEQLWRASEQLVSAAAKPGVPSGAI